MAIATTVKEYLDMNGIDYEVVPHPHTASAMRTAAAAHIPGSRIAKSVVVEDMNGYMMVVLPSTHRVELGTLHDRFQQSLGLATESELATLFSDCELGAIPPFGAAYGMSTVLEPELLEENDIYFEAGDHRELIHITCDQFQELMSDATTYHCSHHL